MHADVTFSLDSYDVVKEMVYPPDSAQYDGLLISGARLSPRSISLIGTPLTSLLQVRPPPKTPGGSTSWSHTSSTSSRRNPP